MCSIITLLFFYEAELRGIYPIEIQLVTGMGILNRAGRVRN